MLVQPVRQLSVLRLVAQLLYLPQPLIIFKHLHAVTLVLKLEDPLDILLLILGTPPLIKMYYFLFTVPDDGRVHVSFIFMLHSVYMSTGFNKV